MLNGAAAGRAAEQYPGGYEQRSDDIEADAARPANELRASVRATSAALQAAWERTTPAAGPDTAWPEEYVARELPLSLATIGARLADADRAAVLAWLVGCGEQPGVELSPWQDPYRSVPAALRSEPRAHPPPLG
jgi:hypothetical protein